MEVLQTLALICFFTTTILADSCDVSEKRRLKKEHVQCTQTVQQRYSLLTIEGDTSSNGRKSRPVSTPLVYNAGAEVNGLNQQQVCAMIEETVRGCASVFDHCFDETEMR